MNTKEIAIALDKIDECDNAYYNNNTPLISDCDYDHLKDSIKNLPPQKIKKLVDRISATLARVGAPPPKDSKWEKVRHVVPMSSLNKETNPEELKEWWESCNKPELLVTEKLDGLSVGLEYRNGEFVLGYTRGDGEIGEDITRNVKRMKGVPLFLPAAYSNFSGHIRGEMILLHSMMKQHFPEMSNPRNAASGIAKRLDGKGCEYLSIMVYTIDGKDVSTEVQTFQALQHMGFDVPWYAGPVTYNNTVSIWNNYMDSKRNELDYDIDGLVIRINNISDQLSLGKVNNRPKGAVAFKFKAFGQKTIVRNIISQVGDTGVITPVAEFDEVVLLGAKIKRASLYNFSNIKNLGIDIGAEVMVKRANDVIPNLEYVISPTGTIFETPLHCPSCGLPTIQKGEYVFCLNKDSCAPQIIGRLNKWISELNIMEWGEKVLQKLIDAKLVNDVADLYKLSVSQITELDRMGEKSAENLIAELDKFREIPLENLIGGLAISGIATSTVKQIMSAGYTTLESIFDLDVRKLESIDGFGKIKAESFVVGLKQNKQRLHNILDAGVKIKAKAQGPFTGKSFCFTGSMNTPRAQLIRLVEDNGGQVKDSVVKGLTYLVISDPSSTSSKAVAARKNGITLISEDQFKLMIN